MTHIQEELHTTRRSFFKTLALGSGVFLVGGILNKLSTQQSPARTVASRKGSFLSQFNVVEKNNEISVLSKTGEELFIIEREA